MSAIAEGPAAEASQPGSMTPAGGITELVVGLTPDGLLGQAIVEMSTITSAHLTYDVVLVGGGSAIRTLTEIQIEGDTLYARQETFGLTMEILQRGQELCVKEPGRGWEARDPGPVLPYGNPRAFLRDFLDAELSELKRVPAAEERMGAYVLDGLLAADELGSISPVSGPVIGESRVRLVLDRSTARPLSSHFTTEVTDESGLNMKLVMDVTMDRHNLPAHFPEGLPTTCSTLTS